MKVTVLRRPNDYQIRLKQKNTMEILCTLIVFLMGRLQRVKDLLFDTVEMTFCTVKMCFVINVSGLNINSGCVLAYKMICCFSI